MPLFYIFIPLFSPPFFSCIIHFYLAPWSSCKPLTWLLSCPQICPEWSWWGTRTPCWGHARCPSWDKRSGASWPSPAHLSSASIWRRRESLWLTTAWLWISGTLWFIYFSRIPSWSTGGSHLNISWGITVKLLLKFTVFQMRTAVELYVTKHRHVCVCERSHF